MTKEQWKRTGGVAASAAVFGAAILALPVFYMITGKGLPCPFKFLTGWDCPGCGATRMLISILHFDFISAAKYNFAVFFTAPMWFLAFFRVAYRYIRYGIRTIENWVAYMLLGCLVFYIIFGILRNIF